MDQGEEFNKLHILSVLNWETGEYVEPLRIKDSTCDRYSFISEGEIILKGDGSV